MQNLQKVFNFEDNPVRTVLINEEPWFVVRDVCTVLEIANSRDAVNRLDDDEKGVGSIDTLGGVQSMQLVNEFGLYSLVLGSRKKEAKEFKRWITHEVIPSLRKTGAYVTPEKSNVIPLDERKVRMELLKTALDHDVRIDSVEKKIQEVERKVDEQITLDHGEQRRVQKAVGKRVYEIAVDPLYRSELFRQLHKEIKDRWAVASYRDVRRTELQQLLKYIDAWIPKAA